MLAGREDEVAALRAAVAAGRSVVVRGEAGLGKTSLVRAALDGEPGVRWGGALASLTWCPLLALRRALGPAAPADDAAMPARFDEAACAVLVLDDLQWADPATLALLPAIGADRPVVAVVRRGDEGEAAALDAVAQLEPVRLELAPLPGPILQEIAGAGSPGSAVADSGGNPTVLGHLSAGEPLPTRLASALAQLVRGLTPEAMARAALLGQHPAAGEHRDAADAELLAAAVVAIDEGVSRLRFSLLGVAAYDALDDDQRRSVHAHLATLVDDDASAAEHLLAAGDARAAALRAEAVAASSSDPSQVARMLDLAATYGESGGSIAARAAEAAIAAAEHDRALELARAIDGDRRVPIEARALARLGRYDDARAVLGSAGEGPARQLLAALLLWPYLDVSEALAAGAGPAGDLVEGRLPPGDADRLGPLLRAAVALARTDVSVARQLLDEHAAGADDLHDRALAGALRAVVEAYVTGACEAARPALERCAADPALVAHRPVLLAHAALAAADAGATGEALAMLDEVGSGQAIGPATVVTWIRAEAELLAGRPRRAQLAAEAARAAGAPAGFPAVVLASLAAGWAGLDRSDLAAPAPVEPGLSVLAPGVDEARGVRAMRTGDWREAAGAFNRAAEGWGGVVARAALRCRWAAAEARRLAGDQAAGDQLAAVEAAAGELGHRPLVARARASLRLLGVRRAPARGVGAAGLTAREVEVLEGVGAGMTSGEIGLQLGIARSTVDTLADNARRKLGARNRRHAAVLLRARAAG